VHPMLLLACLKPSQS